MYPLLLLLCSEHRLQLLKNLNTPCRMLTSLCVPSQIKIGKRLWCFRQWFFSLFSCGNRGDIAFSRPYFGNLITLANPLLLWYCLGLCWYVVLAMKPYLVCWSGQAAKENFTQKVGTDGVESSLSPHLENPVITDPISIIMALLELCLLYHFYYIFLKILVFNTGSHYVPLAGIELTMRLTLALKLWSFCLSFLLLELQIWATMPKWFVILKKKKEIIRR
jgi:hypothetical protein